MGKKDKLNVDHKFSLYVKLSRRIPNAVNISELSFKPDLFTKSQSNNFLIFR